MKSLNEKSMLILTALSLGLIITWLIATDPNNPGSASYESNGSGMTAASLAKIN